MDDGALGRSWIDALPEPLLLLAAVRDDTGGIADFVHRDFNRAAHEAIGVTRADLLDRPLTVSLPNAVGSGLLARFGECLNSAEPLVVNDFRHELAGSTRHVEVSAAPAGVDLLAVSWRDVSDRVWAGRARAQQAEADARFRRLVESADVGIALAGPDGKFELVNEALCQHIGYDQETLKAMSWQDLTPARYLEADLKRIEDLRTGRLDTYRVVKQHIHADGHLVWSGLSMNCLRDAAGAVQYFVGRTIDLTEQMESRTRQVEADARFRRLMENSNVAMALVGPDDKPEVVNQALCDLLGYDEEALKTKTWQELTPAAYLEADLRRVEDLLAGRLDTYRVVEQLIRADGRLIWVDLSVSCLRDPTGGVQYRIVQCIDVTAEVEARERLAEQEKRNRVLAERLAAQLSSAALYVTSILPGELKEPVAVSSRYLPSQRLSGDSFDYRWLDDDHLMVELIDVSGHGVDAALLAVSVHNLLRSGSLPPATLLAPEKVLAELNRLFDMASQDKKYFTIWYGVYQRSTRLLRYASAGHPPALAFSVDGDTAAATALSTKSAPIGVLADVEFTSATHRIPPGSRLLVFSDGAYELLDGQGRWWSLEAFIHLCTELAAQPGFTLDALVDRLRGVAADGTFQDDCALILVDFD